MQDFASFLFLGFFYYIPSVAVSCSLFWLFGLLRVRWQLWDFLVPIIPGVCWITAFQIVHVGRKTFGNFLVEGVILGICTAGIPLWRILHGSGPDAFKGVVLITAFLILVGVALACLCPPIYFGF
jgi:hypothetical protein